jgi:polygalacturonase
MKRVIIAIGLMMGAQSLLAAPVEDTTLHWIQRVGVRTVNKIDRVYGVKPAKDTSVRSTEAIQKQIDACSKNGGGIVRLQPGVYVMGSIFIKSGVTLELPQGVLILGSTDFKDYPEIFTRVAGIEMKWPAALINIMDAKKAAITGEGIIDARGKFCWDLYWKTRKEYDAKGLRWIVDYDVKRIRTILVQNSQDVLLEGFTCKNAGFWTIQLLYSSYLTVRKIVIRNNEDGKGPSTDGVDVDSSEWVLIEDCDIDCNDDNFCMKAGRDWDGLRVNRPTAYVVIRNCVARRGDGLLTLGSETSGGIHHIYATGLKAKNTDNGLRIKSATTRGGVVSHVYFTNCVLDSVKNLFQFNLNWYPAYSYSTLPPGYTEDNIPDHWKSMLQKVVPASKGIPMAKHFYIDSIVSTHGGQVFAANGLPESYLSDFNFTRCRVSAAQIGKMEHVSDWKFVDFQFGSSRPFEKEKRIDENEHN